MLLLPQTDKTAPARKHTSRLTQSVLRRLASRATGLATRTHAECTHAECTQVDALKKEAKPYDNAAANFGSLKHGVNTRASAARTQHSRDRNRSPLPITAIARRCRSPLPLAAAARRCRSPLPLAAGRQAHHLLHAIRRQAAHHHRGGCPGGCPLRSECPVFVRELRLCEKLVFVRGV